MNRCVDRFRPSNSTKLRVLAVAVYVSVLVLLCEQFGVLSGPSVSSDEIFSPLSITSEEKRSITDDETLVKIIQAETAGISDQLISRNPLLETSLDDAIDDKNADLQSFGEGGGGDSVANKKSLHLLSADESSSSSNMGLPSCPAKPPNLVGQIRVKRLKDTPQWEDLERSLGANLTAGGHYEPKECSARQKVAIVIPFRDRLDHLRILLTYLHPLLQSQQLHYGIYLMEQSDQEPFNRAALLNVGFLEASKLENYDCFIFHDVDFIPINDHNMYKCMTEPVLLATNGNRWRGRRPYRSFFGAVVAVSRAQMLRVNGYSNQYWGWGAEDDDMAQRLKSAGYRIGRRKLGMYMALNHHKAKPSDERWNLLNSWDNRMETDGLNTIKYAIEGTNTTSKLYTKFGVKLDRKLTEDMSEKEMEKSTD